jgi:UPF0755 protein
MTVLAGLIRTKSFWAITLFVLSTSLSLLWLQRLSEQTLAISEPTLMVVEPGSNITHFGQRLIDTGLWTGPLWQLRGIDRIFGRDAPIKIGEYQVLPGTSILALFEQLRSGRPYARTLTFPEGWTVAQWQAKLHQADGLLHKTKTMTQAELAIAVTRAEAPLEGWLLPETYQYHRGDSDLQILKKAHQGMRRYLDQLWQKKPHQGLANPSELLTLASVVERESGINEDRRKIARVFLNRLQQGMRLQSDPTIIYGLGAAFDGDLKRRHLTSDGPYNTYTRAGLPPTPICNPGAGALAAVLQPADGDWLYFVGRGDGSSQFSLNLAAHNRAVNEYQRRK